MIYESSSRKDSDTEFFKELDESEQKEIIDEYLDTHYGNSEGDLIRCEKCLKIFQIENWDKWENAVTTCMNCMDYVYCCHYPSGSHSSFPNDKKIRCIDIESGPCAKKQDCSCL